MLNLSHAQNSTNCLEFVKKNNNICILSYFDRKLKTLGLFLGPLVWPPEHIFCLFETALVSIILILELSVLHKSFLELNFQDKAIISRVPCTPVFLRSRTSGFQY